MRTLSTRNILAGICFVAGLRLSGAAPDAFDSGTSGCPLQVVRMQSISGSAEEVVSTRRSRRGSTGHLPRIVRGISSDLGNGVFISGSFFGECSLEGRALSSAGSSDIFAGHLDSNGKVVWFRRFGAEGTDLSPDVATDKPGNCILTGMCSEGTVFGSSTIHTAGQSDAFTAKLDPMGQVLWAHAVGGSRTDCGNEVCTDREGNVLVVGNSYGSVDTEKKSWPHAGGMDSFVLKYSPDGTLLWAEPVTGPADEQGRGIASDAQGNVLIAGEFTADIQIGNKHLTATGRERDVFIAKFSSAGQILWAKRFGETGEDYARGIGSDFDGNIYVTGVFSGEVSFGHERLTAGGDENLFLSKLSPDGDVIWARGITGSGKGHGCEIEVTGDGHAILSGDIMGELSAGSVTLRSSGQRDTFVACFDSTGSLDWIKQIRGTGTAANFAIAFDPSGRVTVAGSYAGTLNCDGEQLLPSAETESFIVTLDRTCRQSDATEKGETL
jgi:hypothetical protein